MLAYVACTHTEHVDLLEVGRYWSARVEGLLRASVRDRPFVPHDQVVDVRFHEFMADEVSMVKRIYAFAEQPMTEDVQQAVKSFMVANPRGKLGHIAYHLESVPRSFPWMSRTMPDKASSCCSRFDLDLRLPAGAHRR